MGAPAQPTSAASAASATASATATAAKIVGPAQKDADEFFKELDRTPLFMRSLPQDAEENDMLAALQSLVYDGTPEEIATNFKNQGNERFMEGRSQYKEAITFYTKGIEVKCKDDSLNSILYSNRAAVNLELKNYRRVLNDCAEAIKLNPQNVKAWFRSARACLELDKISEALDCCDRGLKVSLATIE
ncbi:40S ribosomal protein [Quaeritorhiza haematococci]|nr:40S ribosomal protein [Quaeritorhiza haematococci]